MDFNGNNYTCNTGSPCHEETSRKNRLKSNDSLENGCCDSVRNQLQNCNEHQTVCWQSGNYTKVCEHEKNGSWRGSFPDGSAKNTCEHKEHDSRCDNYGIENDTARFDVNGSNEPCGHCKSGINVVLHRDSPTNQKNNMEPKYNVSFKRCCDDNNQKWEQKRRKRSNPISLTGSFFNLSKMKKSKKQEANRSEASSVQQKTEGSDENGSNFRCTFENCCGNCESYIMEIPQNELNAYQNWQNMEFEAGNTCFDECCCPREMKMYSSNLSVASTPQHEQCCVSYAENKKCCSFPIEAKCEFSSNDRKESSKHCLQRVHFAKADNNTRTNHSSCSFCSRKCTPSKASLFVEIGESIADMCDLRSAQVFQLCVDSKESLKSDQHRKEHSATKRNKSESLRGRHKSKKRHAEAAKCSVNCKGLPAAVTRSYSDGTASVKEYDNDRVIEERTQEPVHRQTARNAKSSTSFQESYDCRAQTESNMCINNKTADCNQQCEAIDHSLWEDIRKAKIWSQLQDTYKNVVKMATTSFGQIMKQSTKLKKKYTKDRSKDRERRVPRRDPPDQLETSNKCWNETLSESGNCDATYYGNVCCSLNENSNIAGLSECQKSIYQTCRILHNEQETTSSDCSSCFSPCDIQDNAYPCNEGSLKDQLLPTCGTIRERGGSDGHRGPNQRKKILNPNSTRRPVPNAREQPGPSTNRRNNNPRNQTTRKKAPSIQEKNEATARDQETERTTMVVDMNLESSTIHAVIEPPDSPYVMESVSYQKRIRAVRRLETYSDAIVELPPSDRDLSLRNKDVPMIEKADSAEQSHQPPKEETKKARKPSSLASKKPDTKNNANAKNAAANSRVSKSEGNKNNASSSKRESVSKEKATTNAVDKTDTKSINKEVQCEIIKDNRVICSDKDSKEVSDQIQRLCSCSPQTVAAPVSPEVQVAEKADNEVALPSSITGDDSPVAAREDAPMKKETVDREGGSETVKQVVSSVGNETAATAVKEETAPIGEKEEATSVEEKHEIASVDKETAPVEKTEGSASAEKEATSVQEKEESATVEKEATPVQEKEESASVEKEVTPTQEKEESAPVQKATTLTEEKEEETPPKQEGAKSTGVEQTTEQAVVQNGAPETTVSSTGEDTKEVESTAIDTSTEKSEAVTSITPLTDDEVNLQSTDAPEPMEFFREFRGRRNYVSVEMQTSSTILTKILSEFQVGNKKRQVLMNIKLRTTLDGSDEEERQQHQQPGSSDTSATSPQRQPLTRDDLQYYYHERQQAVVDQSVHLRRSAVPRNIQGVDDGRSHPRRMERLSSDRSNESDCNRCAGPCGKKKPR